MSSQPLAQRHLTSEEAKVFNQGEISSGDLQLPVLTRPVNILILGTKVLSSDVANPPSSSKNLGYEPTINSLEGLSDTLLLLRFDPANQKLIALSIPRDTRTLVAGRLTKINEANAVGGPASAAKAVSDLLGGVGIDRYVRINVLGVGKLVDALGGVTTYVPQDMRYQDDTQHLYINLKKGEQHLNGDQALQLLRFRHDQYGDIGRIQRQQMLMRSLMEQTLKPATVAKLPQILAVIQSNIDTNLSIEELIALTGFAAKTDRAKVQMLMVPGDFSSSDQSETSYWLPSEDKITALVSHYFDIPAPDYAGDSLSAPLVRIALQDSTGQTELAQATLKSLGEDGYSNTFVDNPWSQPLAKTRIIVQQGNASAGEAIHKVLGFGEVLTESTGNLESDITIRLGQDALPVLGSETSAPAVENPEATESASPANALPSPSPLPMNVQ
ncbi:MAG: LCP family protein [Drouetiella hepatica Uher 2000/2452]|jgi:LCP family protein required for cell wall assembly|uniref:LCP family protein n=1 Tax=Drouetiella hepatica Uher 2000/2452 TaxID=904376 RepID=A0A951Q6F1_9CYAN|nr:LCP family protein [Drouetiella hepatica Uher 2000/2452]